MTAPREPLSLGAPVAGPIPTGAPAFLERGSPDRDLPDNSSRWNRNSPLCRKALQAGRVDGDTTEVDPELVGVFDLAGSVADFARAAARVPGLEFLLEVDDAVPDSLYVVMSNSQAVVDLLALFARWQENRQAAMPSG